MTKAPARLLLAAALALAGCGHAGGGGEAPPLAGARLGGPFTLTDQDGHPFASTRLAGRYAIVYFGYTFCPDVCPTEMQTLGQGLRLLNQRDPAKAAKVQPVFVTVDPARDTPPVLRQYVRAFSPTMIGLTGSEAQIAAVAKEYGVFYQKGAAPKGSKGYLMQHSTQAVLFGPDGKPIALVPVDADGAQVADALARWVA